MSASSTELWNDLRDRVRPLADLASVSGLLEWDQQVGMPARAAAARARQLALLSRLHHDRLTDPRLGDLLLTLSETPDLTSAQRAAVANLRRDRDRAVKVPARLVEELSSAQSSGFQAWLRARSNNDFDSFAPSLERLFQLKREEAAAIDGNRDPYDVLLEGFDPGTTLAHLRPIFARLAEGLRPLIEGVAGRPAPKLPAQTYDVRRQETLHRQIVQALGFDFEAGRLDASEHPFTVGLAHGDIRITTHLYEDDLLTGLGGTLHEAGHGLYEQGLPRADQEGTTLDRAAGLGLHESQSRFWENHVGRSLPFFRWLSPRLEATFGIALSPDDLYAAANPIRQDLIRIFADEVTYNLHIVARFELEVAMIHGDLPITELPAAWSEAYTRLLGVSPPDDRQGCLQDVHWGSGAIGYFPSYTLGNLYAASLWAGLRERQPNLDDDIEAGRFGSILRWLRANVHEKGHSLCAPEIVRDAVGERDGVQDLLEHVWARHGALYGIQPG